MSRRSIRQALRDVSLFAITTLVVAGGATAGPPPTGADRPTRVNQVLPNTSALAVDAQELRRLIRNGSVLLVDVRDVNEYRQAHLPGAVSVPIEKLAAFADALRSSGKTIVTYCHGPSGEKGKCAATLLRGLGLPKVHALAGGFQNWVDEGFVVETMPSAG